jgi:cysteine-rich repeat protein
VHSHCLTKTSGTDPSYHYTYGRTLGAGALINSSISFAAAGQSTAGQTLTGAYVALSCSGKLDTIPFLSYFGTFSTVQASSNTALVVASSPALGTLSSADLSNWGASVHEAFLAYPDSGLNSFTPLAVLGDYTGVGVKTFAGGVTGLPYIIARGATPSGCGNGKWEALLGEECDDGNTKSGDGCSSSCKCESGKPNGDGTCAPGCGDGYWDASLGEQW